VILTYIFNRLNKAYDIVFLENALRIHASIWKKTLFEKNLGEKNRVNYT